MYNSIDQQLKNNDCGVSAVKTLYNIFKIDISRKYIQQNIFTDEQGSRITDIKDFLQQNQFPCTFKILDINYVQGNMEYLNDLFPFILPIENKQGLHYVVVNGIKGKKLKILDPSRTRHYYLSIQELKKIAHFSKSHWELASLQEKLLALCHAELTEYEIPVENALQGNTHDSLFNKLTWFAYLKEHYPFNSKETEKAFLTDLLFNQDIDKLPRHFRSLKYETDTVKIKAPIILSVKPPVQKSVTVTDEKPVNSYFSLFKKLGSHKKLWYIYIFAALFSSTTTQLAVFINQILIDHVLPGYQMNTLILFALGVGIFKLFDLFTTLYKSFVSVHVGNILDKFFLASFDDKLNRFSISYIQSFKKGDLAERLSDAMKLKSFFLRYFTRILVDSIVSLYSLAILFFINWKLSLVVSVVILIFVAWFKIITPYLKQFERKRFIKKADFFSKMLEKLDGIQVIKSFRIENIISARIFTRINDLLNIQLKTKYVDLLNLFVISITTITAGLLILVFLSKSAIEGSSAISLGQIITFVMLSGRIFSSLSGILEDNLALQENEVILKRYLDFEEKTVEQVNKGINDFNIEEIQLQNISFGYFPNDPIIRNINMNICAGDKIKVEGQNGSGKSTLSKILSLLYKPFAGDMLINQTKSSFYSVDKVKEKILLVSNDDILFNDTLEFNITFGKEISTRRMLQLAKQIRFYDFIASKEDGLQFMINENGKNLSTGQRKKIVLMRALFSDAELIILDEIFSGMDAESGTSVEQLINSIHDKTFIIISHEPILNIDFTKKYNLVNGELSLSQQQADQFYKDPV